MTPWIARIDLTGPDEPGWIKHAEGKPQMSLKPGDKVTWNTSQGETHGVVREKRTKDFQFEKQKFTASEDEPAWIVESEKTGAQAAHKETALTKKG